MSRRLIQAAANRRPPIHVLKALEQGLLLPLLLELPRLFIVGCSFFRFDILRHLAESWPSLQTCVVHSRFLLFFHPFRHYRLRRSKFLHRFNCGSELSIWSKTCHGLGCTNILLTIFHCLLFVYFCLNVAILSAESDQWTKQTSVNLARWNGEFDSRLRVPAPYLRRFAFFLCNRTLVLYSFLWRVNPIIIRIEL